MQKRARSTEKPIIEEWAKALSLLLSDPLVSKEVATAGTWDPSVLPPRSELRALVSGTLAGLLIEHGLGPGLERTEFYTKIRAHISRIIQITFRLQRLEQAAASLAGSLRNHTTNANDCK